MDSWTELWKLISDVSKVERDVFFGKWYLICEGEELDEEKAKGVLCDTESEWCLDWSKDSKGLRSEVCSLLKIWSDEHEADDLAKKEKEAEILKLE